MPEKRAIEVRCEPPPGWAEAGPRRATEPDALAERLVGERKARPRAALPARAAPRRGGGRDRPDRRPAARGERTSSSSSASRPERSRSTVPPSRPAPAGGAVFELPLLPRYRRAREAARRARRGRPRPPGDGAGRGEGRRDARPGVRGGRLPPRRDSSSGSSTSRPRDSPRGGSRRPRRRSSPLRRSGTSSSSTARSRTRPPRSPTSRRGGFFEALAPLYGGRVVRLRPLHGEPDAGGERPDARGGAPGRGAVPLRRRGPLPRRPRPAGRSSSGRPRSVRRASRFACGRAVLAAVPNLGTPLASAARWDLALSGWLNLFDLLPPAPAPLLGEFVVEALLWFARRVTTTLAGPRVDGRTGRDGRRVRAERRPRGVLRPGGEPPRERAARAPPPRVGRRPLLRRAARSRRPDRRAASSSTGPAAPARPRRAGRALRRRGPPRHARSAARSTTSTSSRARRRRVPRRHARRARRSRRPGRESPARRRRKAASGRHVRGRSRGGRRRRRAAARSKAPKLGETRREALELTLLPGDRGGATALLLARYGTARVVAEVPRKGAAWREIIRGHERLRACFDGDGRPLPSAAALERWGAVLFETLLPGEARRLWDAARGAAGGVGDRRRLHVAPRLGRRQAVGAGVRPAPAHLARGDRGELHAERRHGDPVRGGAAAASGRSPSSSPPRSRRASRPSRGRRRPRRCAPGSRPSSSRGLARVRVERAVTVEALHRLVADGPCDVLHFVGHGTWDADRRTGSLLLESASGGVAPVEAPVLRALLSGRGLSLVVLNACLSARGSRGDLARGVAPALVAAGDPGRRREPVQRPRRRGARLRARALPLARPRPPLGDATREARLAVRCDAACGPVDWAVPVVYARDPGAVL